jgi:hypothetical protein
VRNIFNKTSSLGVIPSIFSSICSNIYILLLPGSLLSGLLAYYILSRLLVVDLRIAIPLAFILSILIFVLTRYYCCNYLAKNVVDNSSFSRTKSPRNEGHYYPEMHKKDKIMHTYSNQNWNNVFFVIVYVSLLIVAGLGSFGYQSFDSTIDSVFIPWEQFFTPVVNLLYLLAAICLSFFMPGYAFVKMLSSRNSNVTTTSSLRLLKQPLPRFLVAYFLSMLVTGLTVYLFAAEVGFALIPGEYVARQDTAGNIFLSIQNLTGSILLVIYSLILVIFIIHQRVKLMPIFVAQSNLKRLRTFKSQIFRIKNKIRSYIDCCEILSKVTVFGCLFALVVIFTYYLNDGGIVVDQWFHHGRALLISSGNFKDVASSGTDSVWNPPFFSSLLSGFFSLSGLPSVNSYVSINFLNIMPILAFYYFFTSWIPQNKRKAALLATTLFVLSSGFGWIYVVNMAIDSPPINHVHPETASIDILGFVTEMTYDIGLPTSFINVGHPDITTPLLIIALPLGFTLLGLIGQLKKRGDQLREDKILGKMTTDIRNYNKGVVLSELNQTTLRVDTYKSILLITGLSLLGILAHDEYYLFVISACATILIFCPRSTLFPFNPICSSYFASFLGAGIFIILIDLYISPIEYYVIRDIDGFPLIALSLVIVSVMWVLYALSISTRVGHATLAGKDAIVKKTILIYTTIRREILERELVTESGDAKRDHPSDFRINFRKTFKISLSVGIVSVVSYLYLFAFMVWGQFSYDEIRSHVDSGYEFNVPWYFYPVKFGLTGLLGLAFLLSYLFRKFEKEIFVFAVVAVIALLAGPYYDEHRFSKYVMAGMASYAALMIFKLLNYRGFASDHSLSYRRFDDSKIKLRTLINGIVLGTVISFCGMSIFIFGGFVELLTHVEDYNEGSRRDFPTESEMQLIDFLDNKLNNHSQVYNIAMPESELDATGYGLISKINGFSALPRAKLLQSPLTLNSSTLEGLYKLLDYSDTRYIVLPKAYIDTYDKQASLSYPMQFALDNFPGVYENSNYLVLEVPPLSPPRAFSPSSQSQSVSLNQDGSRHNDVALIYQKDAQEWLTPLFSSSRNNNNNNSNPSTPNTDSFIRTILSYENESLTSPSSLFDIATTSKGDRILANYDIENNSNSNDHDNNPDISLSSLYSQNLVRAEKGQGVNTIVIDSMDIANSGTGSGNNGNDGGNTRNDHIALWSKPIPALLQEQQYDNGTVDYGNNSEHNNKTINYIEGTLRVLAENRTHRSNDAGILWKYGNDREYYLALKGSGMELSQREKQVTNPSPLTSYSNNQTQDIDEEREREKTKIKTSLLVQNQEIRRERGIWYNIEILMVDDSFINIYVDDMLRMQVPISNSTLHSISSTSTSTSTSTSAPSSSSSSSSSPLPSSTLPPSISRVGIRSSNNIAEFQPIKVGHISPPTNHESSTSTEKVQQPSSHSSNSSSQASPYPSLASYIKEKKYERHYYPLSMLALSNANYDSFVEGDLSAFSKKNAVLPFDPTITDRVNDTSLKHNNNLVKYYLEYVRNGGNLIVINSEYDYNINNKNRSINSDGIFAQLLSIKEGNASRFYINSYAADPSAIVETSSSASTFASNQCPSSNTDMKSYDANASLNITYNCINNHNSSTTNKAIAPFVIEKRYGDGNIIYLSTTGYFDTIGKSSKNSFLTFNNVINALGLNIGSNEKWDDKPRLPLMESKDPTRIRGDVSITRILDRIRISSGQTLIINSSSFSLLHSNSNAEDSSFDSSYNLSARSITISNQSKTDGSKDRRSTTFAEVGDSLESQGDTIHENKKNISDFTFKDAIIKDLKLYGSYEVIATSSETRRTISIPQPSSYNDYIEFTIPTGFSVTIKLSEDKPAYAEFDILTKNRSSFQAIKVHGGKDISNPDNYISGNTGNSSLKGNVIEFRDLKTDTSGFTSISFLMKSPNVQIINKADGDGDGQRDMALSFRRNSPQGDLFEIKNGGSGFTNTTAGISYVDSYSQPHGTGLRTQFVTYLEEGMQVIRNDNGQNANQNNSIVNVQLPGSVSETAKQAGIGIPWQKVISNTNIAIAALIAIITAVSIRILWSRVN